MGAPDEEAEGQASPRECKPPEPCGTWFGMALLAGVLAAYGFLPGLAIAVVVVSLALGGRAAWVALVARPRARRGAAGGRLTSGEMALGEQPRGGRRVGAMIVAAAPLALAVAALLVLPSALFTGRLVASVDAAGLVAGAGVLIGTVHLAYAARRRLPGDRAYTALGVLVCASIVAMTLMGHFPAWQAQTSWRLQSCQVNVKVISRALQMYAADYAGVLPPPGQWCEATSQYRSRGQDLVCPEAPDLQCGYALNSHLAGASGDRATSQVCLFARSRAASVLGAAVELLS